LAHTLILINQINPLTHSILYLYWIECINCYITSNSRPYNLPYPNFFYRRYWDKVNSFTQPIIYTRMDKLSCTFRVKELVVKDNQYSFYKEKRPSSVWWSMYYASWYKYGIDLNSIHLQCRYTQPQPLNTIPEPEQPKAPNPEWLTFLYEFPHNTKLHKWMLLSFILGSYTHGLVKQFINISVR
jgi:hypothetical protein